MSDLKRAIEDALRAAGFVTTGGFRDKWSRQTRADWASDDEATILPYDGGQHYLTVVTMYLHDDEAVKFLTPDPALLSGGVQITEEDKVFSVADVESLVSKVDDCGPSQDRSEDWSIGYDEGYKRAVDYLKEEFDLMKARLTGGGA